MEGDVGGRSVIEWHPEDVRVVPVKSIGVVRDVDTWQDYNPPVVSLSRKRLCRNQGGVDTGVGFLVNNYDTAPTGRDEGRGKARMEKGIQVKSKKSMDELVVLIRGAGEMASGVAHRLHRSHFKVCMIEIPHPLAVRRAGSLQRGDL